MNRDGKATRQEALYGVGAHRSSMIPPPPLPPALPSSPPPPRTKWPVGYWNSYEECLDELVLIAVFLVSLYQALVWCKGRVQRRLRRGGTYDPISRLPHVAEETPSTMELNGASSAGTIELGNGHSGQALSPDDAVTPAERDPAEEDTVVVV